MHTDRIEKKVLLRASRDRVWHAISDSAQFGSWFGMEFDGPFIAHTRLTGRIIPTTVDPETAKLQQPYAGKPVEIVVDRIEPMRRFAFRWHPFAINPQVDYSKEPMTLILFELADVADGILLTITESGFDKIPLERRALAFAADEGGWEKQTQLIRKYLAMHAVE